jgi:hypothetical protein
MINGLDLSKLYSHPFNNLAALMIHYLAERIIVTPFHVINITTRDPMYAHSDIAALNRGLFESAVNACFLLTGDTDRRMRQFFLSSVEREYSLQQAMVPWLKSSDEEIRKRAERQISVKDALTCPH